MGCALVAGVFASQVVAGGRQAGGAPKPQTYRGLDISVTGLQRSDNVSLRDCPPGANTVRGVIKPGDNAEYIGVSIAVKTTPAFKPGVLKKPVLYDTAKKVINTAQSFGDMSATPEFTCDFFFRVPKGTKVTRFAIESATFDIAAMDAGS
jgi:hypothetical protein